MMKTYPQCQSHTAIYSPQEAKLGTTPKLVSNAPIVSKHQWSGTKKSASFNKIVKQGIQLFDSTENPSPKIITLCEALKTIPQTSVEAEKALSAAGVFVPKLRD
ncbi:hypothetical protein TNCV_455031 [Trichonephila clavipes]|nr:hypothetical protein TNCV_455031 [Trichonephila clavipes]